VSLEYKGYLCTLEDVAAALGCTRGGAHFIEQEALRKCRQILQKRGLTFQDLLPNTKVGEQ
jgi:DNA-directed RNA polymerase specialized sigma24 family protein